MEDAKEKLLLDWTTVFPGVPVPDLEYLTSSDLSLENKILEYEQKIEELKFSLLKKQFLLDKLKQIQSGEYIKSEDGESPVRLAVSNDLDLSNEQSTKDEGETIEYRNNESNENISEAPKTCDIVNEPALSQNETSKKSSISLDKNLQSDCFVDLSESDDVQMRRFSDVQLQHKSYSMEESQFGYPMPLTRRLTDPCPTITNLDPCPKPRPAPRSLPRRTKKPLPPLPKKRERVTKQQSAPETSHLNANQTTPHHDDEVFTEVKDNKPEPIPVSTESIDKEKDLEQNTISEIASDTNAKTEQESEIVGDMHDDDLVVINRNDIEFSEQVQSHIDTDVGRKTSPESDVTAKPIKFNQYYDDEHIYTDINELKIARKVESDSDESYSDSDTEQIYENANMLPRLEPLVDNSNVGEKPRLRKRLGSDDRQAIVFTDNMDINVGNDGETRYGPSDIEAILNGSQESLVDDLDDKSSNAPEIIVVNPCSDDDDYDDDDDEHIYANVDDFRPKISTDDSDSDHDHLGDSISIGLPSPHYTEMTSDQIQLMLDKIQNCSDQSQDESEDEQLGSKSKDSKKRIPSNSSSSHGSSTETKTRARLIAVGRVSRTPDPDSTASKNEEKKSPEEAEEEEQYLKASRMRKLLVHNLLDSEKCYLDCLEMLYKFMKPLRISTESSQPILSVSDYNTIFHKGEELLYLHRDFYEQLEPRVENWKDAQLIGDLFTIIMHSFDIYLAYIGNYKVAMETILKCRQANQQFAAIMDQDIRIVSLKDPLKLEGLLYKPVDRMTQYSLILNDLLKFTSPDHPDHPLIVEVSGALFDLFEQVNVDSSKKRRRQRQLLKETAVVEIDDGERRARSLILFNDVIISAKLKPSGDVYVCKWYASLCDINIKPYENSEDPVPVPLSSKAELDKIRAHIANMRQELRREHMPLQQVISLDSSPPFMKRRNPSGVRASSRGMEKMKKRIVEQERLLHLISPGIPLNIYHKNGKVYTLLVAFEAERQAWVDALRPRLKRIHARKPPSIQLSSLELQQAFETVLKVQRLGQRFGSQMPSPFLGPTRPMSVDISSLDNDKDSLTGFLFVHVHHGKGFSKNSDTYVILEMDSYSHFFKKAKTKPCRGSDPQWDEAFEFEIEACSTLRLICYNKLRLMGDDVSGKCSINLNRENLLDNRNHNLSVSLDRGQSYLKISLCFSVSIDGIKKSASFSNTGVFGSPIMVVCKREKFDIPVIVISCINQIEKRGMNEIGIYRLSGVASEIQQLKKQFNEQTQNALLTLVDTDIHAVAGLLKLYLRELPQSLFTSKLYRKFVEGLSITDTEEKELYMVDILHQLPRANKMTALYLFEHLRRVTLLESENKMGVNNLATVFGPTVLRPPSSANDKENETSSCNVGTFDIGALDVMSQVGIFRYFLGLKNNERTRLPPDDLELWRRLDPERAAEIEKELMITSEEHLI